MKVDHKAEIIKALKKFQQISTAKKEPFKATAYRRAMEEIQKLDHVYKVEDVKDLPRIGKSIYEKIGNVINDNMKQYFNNNTTQKTSAIMDLMQIHGIGPVKANSLYSKGVTVENIQDHKDLLNKKELMGLKYMHDFKKQIPRAEMKRHEETIKSIGHALDPDLKIELVGSFRRKAKFSNDIDVLVTFNYDENRNIVESLKSFVKALQDHDYIKDTFSLGEKKFMGVSRLKYYKTFRRLDILFTTPETFPFALLYFTGSYEFNIKMREFSHKKGYKLNEYNLHPIGSNDNIHVRDEKGIFSFLKIPYIIPKKRTAAIEF